MSEDAFLLEVVRKEFHQVACVVRVVIMDMCEEVVQPLADIDLCQLVAGKEIQPLWNNEWIKDVFVQNMPIESIVDKETLKKVTPVITFRETRSYNEIGY